MFPQEIQDKLDTLPPSTQNNARSIFISDYNRAKGNTSKEYYFAKKYGIECHYDPYFEQLMDLQEQVEQ